MPRGTVVWWKSPVTLAFGGLVIAAGAGVFLQDVFWPQPAPDFRTRVPLPGGGSFCGPLPVQSATEPVDR